MRVIISCGCLSAVTFLLVACTTLSYSSPESVDLSGTWLVDESLSERVMMRPPRDSKQRGDRDGGSKPRKRTRPEGGGGMRSSESGGPAGRYDVDDYTAAQVLTPAAANSSELMIEHVPESMGIRYQNGKYRDIDWGKTAQGNRKMTAGWQGPKLIIETSARRGAITETFSLNETRNTLTIVYDVNGNEFVRVYRRLSKS
ncbi:hypothetical protein GCM10008090_22680 [Arenicella chitinivorans]|uniref:Uncharacterized protein n=1 Tax=Arenicella chitinivorans TaxID=1329800 RepID=A0A918RWP2_9GAMM|nr:hypothetical protein [Arenicella chitinivorans]GHA12260.1 hypothetical protein GCM10008090_22680 [Arenicella chitinivorans]